MRSNGFRRAQPDMHRYAWGDDMPSCRASLDGWCRPNQFESVLRPRLQGRRGGLLRNARQRDVLLRTGRRAVERRRVAALRRKITGVNSCRTAGLGCVVLGFEPGAIDAFVPLWDAALQSTGLDAPPPSGFRCVWEAK